MTRSRYVPPSPLQATSTENEPVKPDPPPTTVFVIFRAPRSRLIELVTVTLTVGGASPCVIVSGLPLVDGVPNVQPVGAVGSVGSVTAQLVPVSNGPTVVFPPAARFTVTSPAPQLYLIANVPAKVDVSALNTLLIFRYP